MSITNCTVLLLATIKGMNVGDIKRGQEIGYKGTTSRFIWIACKKCGKERWVQLKRGIPIYNQCGSCAKRKSGKLNPRWRGGRRKTSTGYILLYIEPNDFFYSMANKIGYIFEHRLVMAKHLNRCLLPWEVVHHKNGVKDDNRLENLELLSANSRHNKILNKEIKKLQVEVNQLKQRITLIEAENVLLKANNEVIVVGE